MERRRQTSLKAKVTVGLRPKLALLVNIIAPYRLPIYQALGGVFDAHIFTSGTEANRATWTGIEAKLEGVRVKRSRGITLSIPLRMDGAIYDRKYVHITPGFFFDLIRFNPRGVITIEMGFRTLVALVYGTIFRKPVWVWWGGTLHTERAVHPAKRFVRKIMARWVKHWISYGQTSTDYLLSLGIQRSRITQIQNCVDERSFVGDMVPFLDLQPRPVLLYVGQLIRRKGVEQLLRAAASVQEEGRDFTLLLVGDGPERAALQQLSKSLGLKNVVFHSALKPEFMPAIYRSADCLVFPTLEDVWGLVVNEALWCGIPVVGSVYAGCAVELLPETNIFDPLDLDAFTQILCKALNGEIAPANPARMQTCAEVATVIVEEITGRLGLSTTTEYAGRW